MRARQRSGWRWRGAESEEQWLGAIEGGSSVAGPRGQVRRRNKQQMARPKGWADKGPSFGMRTAGELTSKDVAVGELEKRYWYRYRWL